MDPATPSLFAAHQLHYESLPYFLSIVYAHWPSGTQWPFVQGMNEELIIKDSLEMISKTFVIQLHLNYLPLREILWTVYPEYYRNQRQKVSMNLEYTPN